MGQDIPLKERIVLPLDMDTAELAKELGKGLRISCLGGDCLSHNGLPMLHLAP